MISTRTFISLPALLAFGALQACSADSGPGGSTPISGSPGTAGNQGISGSATNSSGGSVINSAGGSGGTAPATASGGDTAMGGRKGGGKGGTGSGGTAAGGSSTDGGTSGQTAGGSDNGGGDLTPLGKYTLTFYSFQDNTPVNSMFSASGHLLTPFVSVALPFTQIKNCAGEKPPKGKTCDGTLDYGDKIFVDFLKGRKMPNGMLHTGWVLVDDYCGDGHDDTYCYQDPGDGTNHPIVDIYIGDFSKSGMMPMGKDECSGTIGNGGELINVSLGNPGSLFLDNYGGAAIGTGKCGDRQAARDQQFGPAAGSPFGVDGTSDGSLTACWGYDGQGDGTEDCKDCEPGVTCAK